MKFTFLRADNTEEVLAWNSENFASHLNELPLAAELSRADELELCSPTISIIKNEENVLWASIITDSKMGGFSFVVGYVHDGKNDDLIDVTLEQYLNIAEDYISGVDIYPRFNTPRNQNAIPSDKKRGFFSRLFGF